MKGALQQTAFAIPTKLLPRGDGTFIVQPEKPVAELAPGQAAKVLGVSRSSIYRLIDEGSLTCRRPLRHRILIPVSSIESYRQKTTDPEYWDKRKASAAS